MTTAAEIPSATDQARRAVLEALQPELRLEVSAWADRYRLLESSTSAEPGRWRTDRAPYEREIMDCLTDGSPVERVALMFASQTGKSEVALNWVGYTIHHSPCPMMFVLPTIDAAKRFSQQRIKPMLRSMPCLRELVKESEEGSDAVQRKEFPGGILLFVGGNSGAGLRSAPIARLAMDEVDEFPMVIEDQGDPIKLVEKRTQNFPRRKMLYVSTPTVEGISRIQSLFEMGDQRRYFVPCPHCNTMQRLYWQHEGRYGIVWEEGKPETAHYVCERCGERIEEWHKAWMLARGEWRATAIPAQPRMRSYHLSRLYAPVGWGSWSAIVEEFLEAKHNAEKLRVWVNTVLGEPFRHQEESPDWEKLAGIAESYERGKVPRGGIVLTAGADVQPTRIEVEVVAWGPGMESWSIDYVILEGDIQTEVPWRKLDQLLTRTFPVEGSEALLHVAMLALDTSYNTQTCYQWARGRSRVIAIKGMSDIRSLQGLVGHPRNVEVNVQGKPVRSGVRLWPVYVDAVKRELYSWFRVTLQQHDRPGERPPGFCHLIAYGDEYFRQLVAEHLVSSADRKGVRKYRWEKRHPRNEALDCRVYARAAAAVVGVDRMPDAEWERLQEALYPAPPSPPPPKAPPSREPVREWGYWSGWDRRRKMFGT